MEIILKFKNVSGLDKPIITRRSRSYETAGNTAETKLVIDATRRSQYGS